MGLIYILTNILNSKSYVGQTTRDMDRRLYEHCYYANNGSQLHFHRAIKKYGIESFTLHTKCFSKDLLDDAEIATIVEYDSFYNGYNETKGGKSRRGFVVSKQTRQKLSESHMGQKAWNKGIKMPDRIGSNNYMYGRKHTEETRNKMSSMCKGKNVGKDNRNSKAVILTLPNGIEETFDSITEASRVYGLTRPTLSKVAKNITKQHKGYKCRYAIKEI